MTGRSTLTRNTVVILALGIGVPCASAGLAAQAVPPSPGTPPPGAPPAPAGDGPGVADIIVTANKRAENVQDVPSSVLPLTAAALARANVRDFDDITRIAPSVTITKTSQPANNSINIRGIGTYAYSISTQASVAVVVDDIPQSFQAAAFTALTDVAQIEVLRGPQSTLFGKAASAGVINITTAAPTDHFTARGEMLFTDDHEQRYQASVSGAISDTVKFRLTGNYSKWRGNIYNETTGNWLNGQSDLTFRGKLLWEPAPDWRITLLPYVTRTRSHCCAPAEYFLSPGVTFSKGNVPQSAILGDIVASPDNRRTRLDVDAKGYSTDWGSGFKVAHEFDSGISIMSISSYDHYHLDDLQDTDSSDLNFQLLDPRLPVGGSANGGFFTVRTVTQELRLTSPNHGRLRWVGGFFFSDTHSVRDYTRGSNDLGSFNGVPSLPSSNTIVYASYNSASKQNTYALYGQATYDLTSRLSLIGGLRLHREDLSYNFTDLVNGIVYGKPPCSSRSGTPGLAISTCDSDNVLLGRAAVQYRFSPAFMVFANYARGYKGLAYDLTSTLTIRTPLASGSQKGLPTADAVAARQPVSPENNNSFEVGFKGSFFDRRLTWNVTGFYEIFRNFQAQSRDEVTNQNILNSLGKVTSKGIETEIAARFTPDLTINASGAWNIAKIKRFSGASCFPQQTVAEGCVGGVQDLSGERLPNAPKWNLAVNGEYDHRLTERLTAFFTAGVHYQSTVLYSLLQDPDSYQTGYAITNLAIGLQTQHYKLSVFVNNLFDKNYVLTKGRDTTWNISHSIPIPTDAIGFKPARDADRYVGVRLGFDL